MERSTIREDVFIATLAERDKEIAELKEQIRIMNGVEHDWKYTLDSNAEMEKTIAELRAALNEAADEIVKIRTSYGEDIRAAVFYTTEYRAIANSNSNNANSEAMDKLIAMSAEEIEDTK